MKCMKCNNEANVYITTNINGKVKKEYLCSECAGNMNMKKFLDMDKILAKMFNTNDMLGFNSMIRPATMQDVFGRMSLIDEVFEEVGMLNNMFDKPVKKAKPRKEDKEVEDTIRIKEENRIKKTDSIEMLRYELNKAIEEERYEDAAVLRDKINGKNK